MFLTLPARIEDVRFVVAGAEPERNSLPAPMAKVYVVGLDGSNIGYQALRLAAMVMNPIEDKIEVLHICLPGDDGELATRLAHNAEIELRKAQVDPLRFKICTETLRKPHCHQQSDRRSTLPPPPPTLPLPPARPQPAQLPPLLSPPCRHSTATTHPRDLLCDRRRRRMDSYRPADL